MNLFVICSKLVAFLLSAMKCIKVVLFYNLGAHKLSKGECDPRSGKGKKKKKTLAHSIICISK